MRVKTRLPDIADRHRQLAVSSFQERPKEEGWRKEVSGIFFRNCDVKFNDHIIHRQCISTGCCVVDVAEVQR